jgi:hypothetical protein
MTGEKSASIDGAGLESEGEPKCEVGGIQLDSLIVGAKHRFPLSGELSPRKSYKHRKLKSLDHRLWPTAGI